MSEEDVKMKFERNLKYMQKNIPPDDIYMFAEYTFLAAVLFLEKWCEHVEIREEMQKDPLIDLWVKNVLAFQACRDKNLDVSVHMEITDAGSE